jgi:hypothetical protein
MCGLSSFSLPSVRIAIRFLTTFLPFFLFFLNWTIHAQKQPCVCILPFTHSSIHTNQPSIHLLLTQVDGPPLLERRLVRGNAHRQAFEEARAKVMNTSGGAGGEGGDEKAAASALDALLRLAVRIRRKKEFNKKK